VGVTKVGPQEPGDLPRKKGLRHKIGHYLYVGSGFSFLMSAGWFIPGRRLPDIARIVTSDGTEAAERLEDAGIPEADISEEERQRAMEGLDWPER